MHTNLPFLVHHTWIRHVEIFDFAKGTHAGGFRSELCSVHIDKCREDRVSIFFKWQKQHQVKQLPINVTAWSPYRNIPVQAHKAHV